ncbi:MAG: SpoIIIAH-like family protein [Candidatus Fournierella pullistercoris]|uniref:SpoIIIAH-like family protein n=1 Tax=Candidatus Allofournierella pullistercoris TaxID=2838597 RepID=A0A948T1F8_9FIRM|nr:SpoIIIAH-like family protein [Candidatus Fournierella pullistercoris]
MKSKKPNQKMTFLTLAVALGAAVYLNWEYAKSTDLLEIAPVSTQVEASAEVDDVTQDTQVAADVVTDALPVDAQPMSEAPAADKNYGEAQLVSVSEPTGAQFFEQARLSRTKTRDEALDTLQKSLKNAELSQEEKDALTSNLSKTLEDITLESDVESLIKAKGFVDCVVFVDGDKVNVTVMTTSDGLNQSEVAQIRDVVLSKCEVTAQNITIVEVK